MKASYRKIYGKENVITVTDVEMPSPADNEILVKVHTTTVNRTDIGLLWGKPGIIRLFAGFPKPKFRITGCDFAGQILATGKDVSKFKTGERVCGFLGMGAQCHAEFMTVGEKRPLVHIPDSMSYETAVACMEGAYYAYSSVQRMDPREGQQILLIGGTGAIGSAILQYLKMYGVNATAVCKGEHKELVMSLGADRTIDYLTEDFRKDGGQYDAVIDAVGKSNFGDCKHLLKKNGIYSASDGFINLYLAIKTRITGGKKVFFNIPSKVKEGITAVINLAAEGKFKPLIDRTYTLEQIKEAFKYVATEHKVGNVILEISR